MALRRFRSRGTCLLARANGSARPSKCSRELGGHRPPLLPPSQSPLSWHADLEGHTLPTWYKGTGMHPSLFFPLTTGPLFGVEHHHVSIPVRVIDHRHVHDPKDSPKLRHAFQTGFNSVDWMQKLQDEYGELRGDAGGCKI